MTDTRGVSGCSAGGDVSDFLNSPADYFGHSYTAMHSIARDRLEELQLEALTRRFASLRDRIPVLSRLAEAQKIAEIGAVEEVVPLLFEHTMYKSYPASFLEKGRFVEINKFLSRLCMLDLSGIDVSDCRTIDAWLEKMDAESPLEIMHSSGTSGTMTFLPVSKREQEKHGEQLRVTTMQEFGEDPAAVYGDPCHVIYPFFRFGSSGAIRTARTLAQHIAQSDDRFHTAYNTRMSSDLLYLGARIRAARASGTLSRLSVSPEMLARRHEYEELQRSMPDLLAGFFEDIADKLRGERIFFWGAQNLLFSITEIGRKKGIRNAFRNNSVIGTGGDSKEGVQMPPDWRKRVCDFTGAQKVKTVYGLTEVRALHHMCSHGHYHFAPWVIPFVLDPDTGRALPRSGRTTGRAAFFDLGAETRWGGIISGDEITVEWTEACGCGATTVWAEDSIQRYSLKRGGDDKITCAATEEAHRGALDFLTSVQ